MSKAAAEIPVEEVNPAGLEDESMSTVQENIPVVLFAGQAGIAGRYITPIYGEYSVQAKTDRPAGKK